MDRFQTTGRAIRSRVLRAAIAAVFVLMALLVPVVSFGDAAVENFWNTIYDTDYYVEVSASDGGANLRSGAGVEYEKLISGMMPNGTVLHIIRVATADNGKKWGQCEYQDMTGWVALSQTKETKAPSSGSSSGNSESASNGNAAAGTVAAASVAANYDVKVAAPDGGVNFRYGPGTAYGKIINTLIPNGTRLHISGEGKAANGKTWGLATYNGQLGWIFLGQTEKAAAQTAAEPAEPQETQPAETPEPAAAEDTGDNVKKTEPAEESAPADSGTLTVSTNTVLMAALAVIALLVIVLLLTIVLLTRRNKQPKMGRLGRDEKSEDPWDR